MGRALTTVRTYDAPQSNLGGKTETAVKVLVGSIVWALRRLEKSRGVER